MKEERELMSGVSRPSLSSLLFLASIHRCGVPREVRTIARLQRVSWLSTAAFAAVTYRSHSLVQMCKRHSVR